MKSNTASNAMFCASVLYFSPLSQPSALYMSLYTYTMCIESQKTNNPIGKQANFSQETMQTNCSALL